MNFTIIKTAKKVINGKKALVETLLFPSDQDIRYRVNGKILSYNRFWALSK